MTQNIEDIISTDKQAREIVQKARARREQIMQSAVTERDRLVKEGEDKLLKLKARLANDFEAFRENVNKEAAQELSKKKAALHELYVSNEDKWANDIFSKLTK